jgi:hypothetical protein
MSAGRVFEDVAAWARSRGINVQRAALAPDKAGEFDGPRITLNAGYGEEEMTYYLAHALGSIVRWSLSRPAVQALFDELREAKQGERSESRLGRAIEAYRAFEVESSRFAVWLLAELGHADAVPAYTNFMRADLEALTLYHRTGRAPVWRHFFARWNEEVARGERDVLPFPPEAIPPFELARFERQEILQQQDGPRPA